MRCSNTSEETDAKKSLFYDLGGLDAGATVHFVGQYYDKNLDFPIPLERTRKIREWTTLDLVVNYLIPRFDLHEGSNSVSGSFIAVISSGLTRNCSGLNVVLIEVLSLSLA